MCDVSFKIGGQRECFGEEMTMLYGLGFGLYLLIPLISRVFSKFENEVGKLYFFQYFFSPAQLATQFLTNITIITVSHLYSNLSDSEGILAFAPPGSYGSLYSLWKPPTL